MARSSALSLRVCSAMARLAGAVIALVFLAAAYHKIVDPDDVVGALEGVAGDRAGLLARGLVFFETALAVLLLTGVALRGALVVAAATLVLFSGWIGFLIAAGVEGGCGCGLGIGGWQSVDERWAGLVRNGALLCVCAAGLLAKRGERPLRAPEYAAREGVSHSALEVSGHATGGDR